MSSMKKNTPKFFNPFLTEVEITQNDIEKINFAIKERIKNGEYHGSLLELFNKVAHNPL